MQSGKANHHAPPPTVSVHALDFQYVPDSFLFKKCYLVLPWIVQCRLSLIFQKGKETAVLVFPEITQNFHLRQGEFGIA